MSEVIDFRGVRLAAVAASVPEGRVGNDAFAARVGDDTVRKFEKMVGCVERRHARNLTTRDLARDSAAALREKGLWSADDVDACLFVSQTHDYAFPATACALHGDLGLRPGCLAYDMRMGCSAFVYALTQAAALVQSGACRRILIMGGDCLSHVCAEDDASNRMLFGDAGFAAVVEQSEDDRGMFCRLGTSGRDAQAIYAGWGGHARRLNGLEIKDPWLHMDGLAVFKFTLTVIPAEIKAFCAASNQDIASFDTFCFHQANAMILKQIAMLAGFPVQKHMRSIEKYGNTSPASIPLTLCADDKAVLGKTMMVGFGVGLSWGIASCDLSDCMRLPVREVEDK